MSKSKFKIEGRFDGALGATVTIDRGVGLFSVRPLRRKREYVLPLRDVALMVLTSVVKADLNLGLKANPRKKRRG